MSAERLQSAFGDNGEEDTKIATMERGPEAACQMAEQVEQHGSRDAEVAPVEMVPSSLCRRVAADTQSVPRPTVAT